MGVTLGSACRHCGYHQDGIYLGSDSIVGYNYFPAFQALDKKLVHVNISRWLDVEEGRQQNEKNEELMVLRTLKLFPYFESSMFEKNGFENEILSKFPYLQSKYNYCPRCALFTLEFKIARLYY